MGGWRDRSWQALARGERVDPRWPDYAEYARLRTAGLRRPALAAAARCAAVLTAADEPTRWDFTCWLFGSVFEPGVARSMLLPHGLEAIVTPTLWTAHGNGEPEATAWLVEWFPAEVMASLDHAPDAIGVFLRRGVATHAEAGRLPSLLAHHLVAWVRADVADVANGRYDGDPDADRARLARSR